MSVFKSRLMETVFESFGFGLFSLFDVATVMQTPIGNIRQSVKSLIKGGFVIDFGNGFYSIAKETGK